MLESFKNLFTLEAETLNGRVAMVSWVIYFVVDGVTRLVN